MTQREKNLAMIVVALLVGSAGWWAWGEYATASGDSRSARDSAQEALDNAKQIERDVKRAALERLVEHQERSLPIRTQVAQQEYRAWLVDRLEEAGLDFDDVTLQPRQATNDAYTELGYSANAIGDLAAITRFLHAFYASPLLHKLTSLKILPQEDGRLQANLTVRALVVRGAERTAGIPQPGPDQPGSGRPALGGVDEYLTSVVGRNVFTEYVPPRPPPPKREPKPVAKKPPPKPKFDAAAHAYVTGIVQAGDRLQAWITVRTTGEVLRLSAGDKLHVGLLDGAVESVSAKRIIVRIGDERFATPLGSHLREGEPLEGDVLN